MGRTIVILGGGIGGIVAANTLRKLLPWEHKIVLIERNRVHSFAPSYLWLMVGARKPEKISIDISRLLRDGIDLINAEATALLIQANIVETTSGSYKYDYLIVSLGIELAPQNVPGLDNSCHTYYTLDGSQKLFNALSSFEGGRIAVVLCSLPYKCPAAPHEGAMLIDSFFRKRGMRNQVKCFSKNGGSLQSASDAHSSIKRLISEEG